MMMKPWAIVKPPPKWQREEQDWKRTRPEAVATANEWREKYPTQRITINGFDDGGRIPSFMVRRYRRLNEETK
jgi:hypothetical protein